MQQIDLAQVEAGIEIGLKMMAEMIAQQNAGSPPAEHAAHAEQPAAEAKCPAVEQIASSSEEPLRNNFV